MKISDLQGKTAPTFKLKNQNGEAISLDDYIHNKNVVIYFYPKALTPGCTTQACGIRDYKKEFENIDTVVLGISGDSVEKLKKFREKKLLNFDLLSDEDRSVSEEYGVWGEKTIFGKIVQGIKRTTFIIGKDGKIKHILKKVKTKTHHEDVYKLIKSSN